MIIVYYDELHEIKTVSVDNSTIRFSTWKLHFKHLGMMCELPITKVLEIKKEVK